MYNLDISTGTVKRDSDGKQIAPCDSWNDVDFQAYLAWVNAGGQVTVVEPAPPQYIPEPITDTQARLVLLENNLLAGFEQWINSDERSVWWETADLIHFDNPQVQAAITNSLVTHEQMVALFEAAARM